MKENRHGAGREHWGSSLGFILAAAGSAIGLGNIWKFPYVTGENGGGAFVLVYLVCIAAIGVPVMLCELVIGRHTQRNPVGAFAQLTPSVSNLAHGIGVLMILVGAFLLAFRMIGWAVVLLGLGLCVFRFSWRMVGAIGVLAGFTILAFYSVVAGWTLGYIVQAASGRLDFADVAAAGSHFGGFIHNPYWAVGSHAAFMLLCVWIVTRGVRSGIERWSKILMPVLFVLLLVLIVRGLTLPGAMAGVRFYLSPGPITGRVVLEALGLAFFSLSLGMGAMITYGSYLSRSQNLYTSTLSIVALDTLLALMAGLAIFPAVFAQGFGPDAGPGLVFLVLPTVFHTLPLGALWATLFFLLLSVAALTSGISLLEVVTAYFIDERGWTRRSATWIFGAVIFLLGALCAVSVSDWHALPGVHRILSWGFGEVKGSFFDVLDHVSSNWMLPLGGLFISVFVGWIWGTRKAVDEIRHGAMNFADAHLVSLMAGLRDDPGHRDQPHVLSLASLWGIFIRFVSPLAVLIAFLNTIGWLEFGAREPSAESAAPEIEAVESK